MVVTKRIKEKLTPKELANIKSITETDKSLIIEYKIGAKGDETTTWDYSKKYMKVLSSKGADSADILLYGFIGQDYWWDEKLDEESITDIAFIKTIRELEKDFDRINIRINTPGGSVYHGDPIITAIRNSTAEIHTYNDGVCASMGFDIWLAGNIRHMSINSKLMCHATSSYQVGTAEDMRDAAERLEIFDNAAVDTFEQVSTLKEEEIRERFYNDYKDHWLTAKMAKEIGLIKEIEDYEVEEIETEKTLKDEIVKSITTIEVVTEQVELTTEEMITKLKETYGDRITIEAEEKAEEAPEEVETLTEEENFKEIEKVKGLSADMAQRIIDLHD